MENLNNDNLRDYIWENYCNKKFKLRRQYKKIKKNKNPLYDEYYKVQDESSFKTITLVKEIDNKFHETEEYFVFKINDFRNNR